MTFGTLWVVKSIDLVDSSGDYKIKKQNVLICLRSHEYQWLGQIQNITLTSTLYIEIAKMRVI